MPGFIKNIDKVKAKGYQVIACVTVNDPFVTAAWSKDSQATDKVHILADPAAEFTKVLSVFKGDKGGLFIYLFIYGIKIIVGYSNGQEYSTVGRSTIETIHAGDR